MYSMHKTVIVTSDILNRSCESVPLMVKEVSTLTQTSALWCDRLTRCSETTSQNRKSQNLLISDSSAETSNLPVCQHERWSKKDSQIREEMEMIRLQADMTMMNKNCTFRLRMETLH